ncbi:hypothetical protein ACF3NG_01790 [Aerococcaceae bacterium WGS1372]
MRERDKSNDFWELISSHYLFIGSFHAIINNLHAFTDGLLEQFMTDLVRTDT